MDVEKAAKIRSFTIHTLHEKLLTWPTLRRLEGTGYGTHAKIEKFSVKDIIGYNIKIKEKWNILSPRYFPTSIIVKLHCHYKFVA